MKAWQLLMEGFSPKLAFRTVVPQFRISDR